MMRNAVFGSLSLSATALIFAIARSVRCTKGGSPSKTDSSSGCSGLDTRVEMVRARSGLSRGTREGVAVYGVCCAVRGRFTPTAGVRMLEPRLGWASRSARRILRRAAVIVRWTGTPATDGRAMPRGPRDPVSAAACSFSGWAKKRESAPIVVAGVALPQRTTMSIEEITDDVKDVSFFS